MIQDDIKHRLTVGSMETACMGSIHDVKVRSKSSLRWLMFGAVGSMLENPKVTQSAYITCLKTFHHSNDQFLAEKLLI